MWDYRCDEFGIGSTANGVVIVTCGWGTLISMNLMGCFCLIYLIKQLKQAPLKASQQPVH